MTDRVLVYEYAVARGERDLVGEGKAMLEALLLSLREYGVETVAVAEAGVGVRWADVVVRRESRALELADAAVVIAPETDGVLAEKVREFGRRVRVLGPSPEAVEVAGDKLRTLEALEGASTFRVPRRGGDVTVGKPVDGVGSEGVRVGSGELEVGFVPGSHHSLLCVTDGESVEVVGINDQFVALAGGEFVYLGGRTPSRSGRVRRVARDVAEEVVERISGLSGVFGVDVVMRGDVPYVIEVNPRPTTPVVGAALEGPERLAEALLEGPSPGVWSYSGEYVFVRSGAEALVPEGFRRVERFGDIEVYRRG
jgi:predicted ATP-grasp superfamily ATP-dependent carboligase